MFALKKKARIQLQTVGANRNPDENITKILIMVNQFLANEVYFTKIPFYMPILGNKDKSENQT